MKYLSILLFFFTLAFQNCSEVSFSELEKSVVSNNTNFEEFIEFEDIIDYNVFLVDSFERKSIFSQSSLGFGWREFVEDNGAAITEGFTANRNVDARIVNSDEFGVIADQDRALFFRGRKGGSFHKLYLISKTIDLTGFDYVVIDFRFLNFNLENNKYNKKETLRLEVCTKDQTECGLYPDVYDKESLSNETLWASQFSSSHAFPKTFNNNLTGLDQNLNDWTKARVVIDLKDIKDKSQFVFRFSAWLDEGFIKNDISSFDNSLEDGITLDLVEAMAFNYPK